MTNHPFHTSNDCDENCRCCATCYVQTGDSGCGRLCEHWHDNDPDVAFEVDEAEAQKRNVMTITTRLLFLGLVTSGVLGTVIGYLLVLEGVF